MLAYWKRFYDYETEFYVATGLTSFSKSVLQDDPINDLPAKNASPSEIILGLTIEFLVSHRTSATVTFHSGHLLSVDTNLCIRSLDFKAAGRKMIHRLTNGEGITSIRRNGSERTALLRHLD
jgi:hypothetical protein